MEVDVQPEDNNMKLDGNKCTETGIVLDDKPESTKSPDMKREKDYSIKTLSGTSHSNLPCKKGKELRFGIENILDRPEGSKVKSTSEDGAKKNREEETNSGVSSASQICKSALPVAVRNPFLLDNYFGSSSAFPQFGPCITSPDILWSWRESNKEKFNMTRRVGHPYQNRTPPKRKKPRTSFTRMTIMELEKRFERQKYLASSERSSLAKSLKISDSQVKTWFQNRRTKWRRQAAEEKEIERQTAKRLIMTMSNYSSPKTVHFSENVCVSKILSPDQRWVRQSKSSAT